MLSTKKPVAKTKRRREAEEDAEVEEILRTPEHHVTVTFAAEQYLDARMLAKRRGLSIEDYLNTLVREELRAIAAFITHDGADEAEDEE